MEWTPAHTVPGSPIYENHRGQRPSPAKSAISEMLMRIVSSSSYSLLELPTLLCTGVCRHRHSHHRKANGTIRMPAGLKVEDVRRCFLASNQLRPYDII